MTHKPAEHKHAEHTHTQTDTDTETDTDTHTHTHTPQIPLNARQCPEVTRKFRRRRCGSFGHRWPLEGEVKLEGWLSSECAEHGPTALHCVQALGCWYQKHEKTWFTKRGTRLQTMAPYCSPPDLPAFGETRSLSPVKRVEGGIRTLQSKCR